MCQVIVIHRVVRQYERPAVAIGTQPHVGAVDDAICCGLLQDSDQHLTQFDKEFLIADLARTQCFAWFSIGKYKIDVRRQVQFPAAELAKPKYRQRYGETSIIPYRLSVAFCNFAVSAGQRYFDDGIGKFRQCGDYFFQCCPPRKVAPADSCDFPVS